MEYNRARGVATRLQAFPIMKTDGTWISGATGLDSEYTIMNAHGGSQTDFVDCAHEATEIGTSGLYYLDLDADEVDGDFITIKITSTSTGAIKQVLHVNTTFMLYGDLATVDEMWQATNRTLTALDEDGTAVDLDSTIGLAVWNYVTRSLTEGGSSLTAQQIWEYATRTITSLDEDVTTMDIDTAVAAAGVALASILLHQDLGDGTNDVVFNERTVRSALRFLRNKWSISGTTLTVTTENDTTQAWQAQLTATEGADPVTGQDPT